MGGSVNLQGGGQYQTPSIGASGRAPIDYGPRFRNLPEVRDRGYDQYGNFGGYGGGYRGGYGNVSTGGKGFQQQQPEYQPAPVMRPYVDQISTGGKGFQGRPTPAQSVAYAPMNIPQMQFAQPQFFSPNIARQMAFLQGTTGMGGLGALGAFQPMMPRQPLVNPFAQYNPFAGLSAPQPQPMSLPEPANPLRPPPQLTPIQPPAVQPQPLPINNVPVSTMPVDDYYNRPQPMPMPSLEPVTEPMPEPMPQLPATLPAANPFDYTPQPTYSAPEPERIIEREPAFSSERMFGLEP